MADVSSAIESYGKRRYKDGLWKAYSDAVDIMTAFTFELEDIRDNMSAQGKSVAEQNEEVARYAISRAIEIEEMLEQMQALSDTQ